MDIFHFNIKITFLLFLSFSLGHHLSFFLFFHFLWHSIFNPSDPMTDPQHVLQGDSSRQSDLPLRAPLFPQNHIGFNEGEPVLPLSRLHLHRSSEVGFFWFLCFILECLCRLLWISLLIGFWFSLLIGFKFLCVIDSWSTIFIVDDDFLKTCWS